MSAIAAILSHRETSPLSGYNRSSFDVSSRVASAAFRAASLLSDPLCTAHELFRRIQLVTVLHPSAHRVTNYARALFLCAQLGICATTAILTTLPGLALRSLGVCMQKEPFMYVHGEIPDKQLVENNTFSLLSWNVCFPPAGYSISDGGVLPCSFRINRVIAKISETDADITCLYEVMDIRTALYICNQLKHQYAHFYLNIGPRAVGVSSGLMVASKYAIDNPEFTPFPLHALVGRTRHMTRGVFGFDLKNQTKHFARIFTTHLQNSRASASPTETEQTARHKQMTCIAGKVAEVGKRQLAVVLTGDLNMGDEEFRQWSTCFDRGMPFQGFTWGGDKFCINLVGDPVASGPVNLDHTAVAKGTATIRTALIETGFEGTEFRPKALSDHAGLWSQITPTK